MSGNPSTNNSVGGLTTFSSMTGRLTGRQASGALKRSDGKYTKAILKDEIKVTKLNPDNYQSWADGIEFLLDAKML